jgi:hypothetical protein
MTAALTRGTRFFPPSKRRVYIPIRNARSWRKKISAIVADGRHSTGLTATPWKMRASIKEMKFGESAHHTEVAIKRTAPSRYTGRLPQRMAVGEKTTELGDYQILANVIGVSHELQIMCPEHSSCQMQLHLRDSRMGTSNTEDSPKTHTHHIQTCCEGHLERPRHDQ